MSAKNDLIESLMSPDYIGDGEYGFTEEVAHELVNAYAHELAEKQRAFDGPSMTMAGNRMVPLDLITAVIDPEVSSDG